MFRFLICICFIFIIMTKEYNNLIFLNIYINTEINKLQVRNALYKPMHLVFIKNLCKNIYIENKE